MNKILLKLAPTGWIATFLGPIGDDVEHIFGTRTLPTGFTVRAEPSYVLDQIQDLNRGCIVEVIA